MVDHSRDIAAILAIRATRIGQQRMIALVTREHLSAKETFDAIGYCDDVVRNRKGNGGQCNPFSDCRLPSAASEHTRAFPNATEPDLMWD